MRIRISTTTRVIFCSAGQWHVSRETENHNQIKKRFTNDHDSQEKDEGLFLFSLI